ncbi:hypothetical protein COCNU_09G003630 [Cocos nucifera]|uniref:Uncharacterized protein n=1 Tax=Cocos nucifera TaxID=13894 RepID=A0A8K0N735_COCNU|nr:hypothetical protein COCNU_09G003630 [Cocos nucifera]
MVGKEPGRCRRHLYDHRGAAAGGGVCPSCLRHRLLLLCPQCAQVRPCPCSTPPSLSSSSSPAGTSSASSDLAASRRRESPSVGCGRRRPPGRKGNAPRSSSVRVAGNVRSVGGKGGGLKWLNRVFLMVARAFGGRRKTAKWAHDMAELESACRKMADLRRACSDSVSTASIERDSAVHRLERLQMDATARENALSDEVSRLRVELGSTRSELESVQSNLKSAQEEVKTQKSYARKKKRAVENLKKDRDNWAKEAEDFHQKWQSTDGEAS